MNCLACGNVPIWKNDKLECSKCGDNGGYLVHPYNQDCIIKQLPPKYKDGVCEGVSMFWIKIMLVEKSNIGIPTIKDPKRVNELKKNSTPVKDYVKTIMDEQEQLIDNLDKIPSMQKDPKTKDLIDDITKQSGRANNMVAIVHRGPLLRKKIEKISSDQKWKQNRWEMKGNLTQFRGSSKGRLMMEDTFLTYKAYSEPILALFSIQGGQEGHAMVLCFTKNFIDRKGVIFFDPNYGEIYYNSLLSAFGKTGTHGVFKFLETKYKDLNELYFAQLIGCLGSNCK